ncbi:hypothetical protein [Mycobacteroides franklinii]|uniref:DUF4345 domain-containing protein n=1 Tax=Mycobacteroides franklinii TaxID=948102 RepID=A0A4V3HVA7_9MYCO|nr:hypothetical protein [Mycobacteroides franklinii]TDZ44320.1 hypothetical protein CCUG64054_04385 [Mycobacteroides franklinii]TDZ51453.1 hypothetical protein CCUG63697_02969 [Mycobacteroides franklinii]TDZ57874.1 hypothetical protein CCUG63696_04381 [Mycobacteroides franklinii]TDZ64815.1 hypothetical protein CCUG63695_04311 [Mycobacteroides franklinii]TDZ71213.1 hypothetical protein CCUG64056_04385 [Mycobacteroides franklinii]
MNITYRLAPAMALAVSGYAHAYLYMHGYQHIPTIGPAFLVQAAAFFAMAVLIVVGAPDWMVAAAGLGSAGALVAFALSRTVGLFGFSERGWTPAPYAVISVLTELAAVALASVLLAKYVRRPVPATPTSRTESLSQQ